MYKVYSLYACPIWKLLETYTIMPACLHPLKTSRLHPATVEVSTRRKWKLWPRAPTFLHMPAPHKPTVACSRNPCPETICPICPQKGNGREDLNLPCLSMEIRSEAIQMPQLLDVQSIPGVAVLRAGGCQSAWHRGARLGTDPVRL